MKKYKIIYADPPWRYARSKVQGAAEKHYPTMSIEELCALPVKEIADKDCILFLWATFPQLKEALQLIKAWGFTYKSVAFVWLKQNRKSPTWFYGLGFWTRGNAEICLLATKGHQKRQSNKVHQFIISPVEQHSKKPDITREKILALMGDLPRIELFARQHTPGWDVWGNEIKSDIRFAGKDRVTFSNGFPLYCISGSTFTRASSWLHAANKAGSAQAINKCFVFIAISLNFKYIN